MRWILVGTLGHVVNSGELRWQIAIDSSSNFFVFDISSQEDSNSAEYRLIPQFLCEFVMSTQKSIGRWIMSLGQLLLFGVFVFCCVDVFGYSSRGHLMGSLSEYLVPIFAGVAMQFIGSAISHAKPRTVKK